MFQEMVTAIQVSCDTLMPLLNEMHNVLPKVVQILQEYFSTTGRTDH